VEDRLSERPLLRHLMRRKISVREPFSGLMVELIIDLHHNETKDLLVLTAKSPTGEPVLVERLLIPGDDSGI
jgi:hypothetical protein